MKKGEIGVFEKLFKLKEHNTTIKTEILAGITTFMTMAYILAVNPTTLTDNGNTGMSMAGVFIATALAAVIGTLLMAFCANYPFALAPGMGLNAYFCYTVIYNMGYTWQQALAAVFVEGIIFIILSVTNVREAIFNSIPKTLKHAVSCGIGLFIAFIGMQNANIVESNSSTLVQFHEFSADTFSTTGIGVILALIGVIITAVFLIKKIKSGILIGILSTWILGIICQLIGIYQVNPEAGVYNLIPDFSKGLQLGALKDVAFHLDFSLIKTDLLGFIVVILAFLFVDMFDTLGTLMGVATKANMLDKNGRLPNIRGALLADAVATSAGALLGTSTTTTYVESATGVTEGGRTGLTSLTTGILFGAAIFLSPIFLAIPSFATAPALIIVGFYMIGSVVNIDFTDMTEAIPAFICILAMPFMYSISDGIFFGVISYVIINLLTGKAKEKNISVLMYILAVLFILKYIFI